MSIVRNFKSDNKGATAVEFALVSSFMILTMLFILIVSLILYMNQALDNATGRAARQIMIGSVQASALSQSDFRTKMICANLPSAFDCSKVIVNLQSTTPAAGYYQYVRADQGGLVMPTLSTDTGQYSPGSQQTYEYLQVIYPVTFLPNAFAAMLSGGATYNGTPAYLVVATAAFRNEQY